MKIGTCTHGQHEEQNSNILGICVYVRPCVAMATANSCRLSFRGDLITSTIVMGFL